MPGCDSVGQLPTGQSYVMVVKYLNSKNMMD